jgi:hypothetical protein
MKYVLLVFMLMASFSLSAQDIIIKKDGTEIQAKVTEVNELDIKYKKFDNQDGPVYTLLKAEVFMVKYQNGDKEVYNENNSPGPGPAEQNLVITADEMYRKGIKDAGKNYYPILPWLGTLGSTMLFWPAGLGVTIGTFATPPKEKNLNIPDDELFKDPNYKKGYKDKAYKIKKTNAVLGFATGTLLLVTVAMLAN